MTKISGYFTVLLKQGNSINFNAFFSFLYSKQDSLVTNIRSQLYNLRRKLKL